MKCDCGRVWLWDWLQDVFRYPNGESVKALVFGDPREADDSLGFGAELYVCKCGKVNAMNIRHEEVGSEPIYEVGSDWNKIDLEADENSWDEVQRSRE